jgi:hypothetical protein
LQVRYLGSSGRALIFVEMTPRQVLADDKGERRFVVALADAQRRGIGRRRFILPRLISLGRKPTYRTCAGAVWAGKSLVPLGPARNGRAFV